MEDKVIVSIICLAYNIEKYVPQALDSILMQKTNFRYEILIGEDCSIDNTADVLKGYEEKFPDKIHVFYREKNMGVTKNMYSLFLEAKGKYIATLDLDDYWIDKDKLQKQYDFLETHEEYMGVIHDLINVDENGNLIQEEEYGKLAKYYDKDFYLQDFLQNGFIFQTGSHFYRNIFLDGNDYSVILKAHKSVVDYSLLSILLQKGKFYVIGEKMTAYRRFLGPNATNVRTVTTKNLAQDYYNTAEMIRILNDYFGGEIDYSEKWADVIYDYLKALLRKKNAFNWKQFIHMYHSASKKTKKMIRKELMDSIKRVL